MIITVRCENKEEVKDVLNLFKDAIVASTPKIKKDESDEPKPEAFRPKEGDICTYMEDGEPAAIFRFNGKEHNDEDGVRLLESELSLEYSGNLLQPYIIIRGEGQEVSAEDCRLATEEETKFFLDMTKTDKENSEWVPRKGDSYWTPSFDYDSGVFRSAGTSWEGKRMEVNTHRRGWSFRTKEEGQQLCDKLNEAIKNVKL